MTSEKRAIQLQRVLDSGRTCPYCRDELAPRGPAIACPECSTGYHLGCVSELGEACALLGCAGTLERSSTREKAPPVAPTPRGTGNRWARSTPRGPLRYLIYRPFLDELTYDDVRQMAVGWSVAFGVLIGLGLGLGVLGWAARWIYHLGGPNGLALAALLSPLVFVLGYAKLVPTRGRASPAHESDSN